MKQRLKVGSQKKEVRGQKAECKNPVFLIKGIRHLFSVFCSLLSVFYFLFSVIGCDAFVRKFTRKPKKENLSKETMVLAPMEYKSPDMSTSDLYRQYFLYWKSWHDELIESLSGYTNHKKQIDCASETIKNLEALRALLKEEGRKKITIFITQLNDLKNLIEKDPYGDNALLNLKTAERIKRNILRDFSFDKIKDSLL